MSTQTQTESPAPKRPTRRIVMIILISLLAVVLVALAVSYFVLVNYFKSHFFPNIIINNVDCSYMDSAAVVDLLEEQSKEYFLEVTGRDGVQLGTLTAEDIGLNIDIVEDVNDLLSKQDFTKWILAYRSNASYEIEYEIGFDAELLREQIVQWDAFQDKNMEAPQDAYLAEYSPESKEYQIVPETKGSLLKVDEACDVLAAAVQAGQNTADLEDAECYVRAQITTEDKELQKKVSELNQLVHTRIVYDWNGKEVILDGDTIHEWIIEEDGSYSIDEEAVAEFVAVHAKENDTFGKSKKFTTTHGTTVTLPNGGYGWKTDRDKETEELLQLIKEGAVIEREPVYRYTGYHKGEDDIGPSYVEIDLANQYLYLYIDGKIVLESDIVSGGVSRGKETPPGLFGITYKTTDAVLRGADYAVPVKYWMPFNGNIGMHDYTYRSAFGGDIYITDGSRGCINLPLEKAKEIYGYVSAGFPVICYN